MFNHGGVPKGNRTYVDPENPRKSRDRGLTDPGLGLNAPDTETTPLRGRIPLFGWRIYAEEKVLARGTGRCGYGVRRSLGLDVLVCPRCGGRIALIDVSSRLLALSK